MFSRTFKMDEFRAFHPDMVKFNTDPYYLNVANVLYDLISKSWMGRELEWDLRRSIAMSVAHYFEDIECDLGIWRSFTEIHHQRYGSPLPFYSLDDIDEYYPDELHVQDIQFLIWNVMQSAYDDRFMNPENPGLMDLAKAIYAELDTRYQQAPVNEQYITFAYEIVDANHHDAPFLLRHIWTWLLRDNYLLMTDKVEEKMQQYEESLGFMGDYDKINYTTMSNACLQVKYGPLNLTAAEWFAAMCKGEESENAQRLSKKIDAMDYRELMINKIISFNDDSVRIENYKGEVLDVPFSGFSDPEEVKVTASESTTLICALLQWDNVWMPFGIASWGEHDEEFAEMKEKNESNQRTAEFVPAKVKEKFGEQRLFFLKDKSQINKWFEDLYGKEMPMTGLSENYEEWPDDEPIAMYLDDMGDFCIAPIASAIALDDNPFYDPAIAAELGLAVLMFPDFVDKAFADYLVSNNLLPDAACNSLKGHEHGRKLIQSNIGFLKEYFRGIW